ncbi:HesB/IscA family protein [Bacteroidota bacterium]
MSAATTEPKVDLNTPISLTERAAEEIQKIVASKDIPEGYGLRVGVKGGGCSGMSYILGFDKKREHDLEFRVQDIVVFVDKRQGLYLMNTVVGYQDGLKARGFVFENPNATTTCGCGSSFAA